MTEHLIDFTALRADLRALNRGSLLIIAERAIELMPAAQLSTLLSDFMRLAGRPVEAGKPPLSLPDEVRAFYEAAMAGKYDEAVAINNQRRQIQSESTDAFIADFDRLLRECVRVSDNLADSTAKASFELLFGLLRHIDEGNDDVLFFADDDGISSIGINWHAILPAYISSLARTSLPDEFGHAVDATIEDFAREDRPYYLAVARNAASDAQRISLDAIVASEK
ncbi:hypothetical protein [Janthinobacterium sp. PC23-8]|uniref:hypothetical protein n=1 Tax=Janthinobacterium sp. PC23-8 TaxID=2012679 RepID=UPI000B95FECB|nr:hypothetical protein [Janthinobacterium sp. PC23-8]OYO27676.1 hypothetical protein CD932_21235 [Janthinobacterium sp. PC23-8]